MNWLLSPLAWLLLAALLAAVAWRARLAWLGAGGILLAVVAFAAMTPWVANTLVMHLEQPVADPVECRSTPPSVVVVLAGGVDRLPRTPVDFGVMNLASRRRLERGVQYWRERDGRQIVVAGGPIVTGWITNAELMDAYARWLGIPANALRLERRSNNTWENARNVAGLVPRVSRRIALVTSALHMPRARSAFLAAGFEVCPLPTDFQTVPVGRQDYWMPRSRALIRTEAAVHELVGMHYYRWLDRKRQREKIDPR